MTINLIIIALSLIGLAVSADKFITGAYNVARIFNLPTFIVGFVIVGFGTSAPEIAVAVFAALEGSPFLAIGNAIGSNIANILLVLGATSLIMTIQGVKNLDANQGRTLVAVSALTFGALIAFNWHPIIGVIMIYVLLMLLFRLSKASVADGAVGVEDSLEAAGFDAPETLSKTKAFIWVGLGGAVLLASSKFLVMAATEVAAAFGLSEAVIGLTIVAIGTSLPELAASVSAALKRESQMVLGGIIGSNVFNTLAVLSMPTIISGVMINTTEDLLIDIGLCLGLTTWFWLSMKSKSEYADREGVYNLFTRKSGILMLAVYAAYLTLLALR